jgi:hypothetical protein
MAGIREAEGLKKKEREMLGSPPSTLSKARDYSKKLTLQGRERRSLREIQPRRGKKVEWRREGGKEGCRRETLQRINLERVTAPTVAAAG